MSIEIDPFIKQIISQLGGQEEPSILPIFAGEDSEVSSCFGNVEKKVLRDGGRIKYGWILHLEPYLITAEFHAIWENNEGELIDITPDEDPTVRERLFVIDKKKVFEGERIENIMLNISGCSLIDDLILLKKASFRFMETDNRKMSIGRIDLDYEGQIHWDIIAFWSYNIMHLFSQNIDFQKYCFCGSEFGYIQCHRKHIMKLVSDI